MRRSSGRAKHLRRPHPGSRTRCGRRAPVDRENERDAQLREHRRSHRLGPRRDGGRRSPSARPGSQRTEGNFHGSIRTPFPNDESRDRCSLWVVKVAVIAAGTPRLPLAAGGSGRRERLRTAPHLGGGRGADVTGVALITGCTSHRAYSRRWSRARTARRNLAGHGALTARLADPSPLQSQVPRCLPRCTLRSAQPASGERAPALAAARLMRAMRAQRLVAGGMR